MDVPEFFAIDIGNSSLKVLQLKRTDQLTASLHAVGKLDMPADLLANESAEGQQKLADLISQVRDAAGIRAKNCVIAVPEENIFSRLLTIPKVEPTEIEQTVYWEMKPIIPVPLENVDIAYLDIGEKEVAGRKMLDMYVVAAPKTLTDRYRSIIDKAKLNLLAIETESLALTRCVVFNNPQLVGDIVIVDMGSTTTTMVLARDGVVVFARTSSIGSNSFTKVIATDYGINEVEAEKYKRAFGLKFDEGEGKVAKSIDPIMQILTTDMSRAISYFRERVGGQIGSQLYLTGDGANLPGLLPYLQSKLNMQPLIVSPFQRIGSESDIQKKLQQLPQAGFSVAVGLALKTPED